MGIAKGLAAAAMLAMVGANPAAAADGAPFDPDVRCVASMAYIVGQMEKAGSLTGDTKAGLASVLLYFVGKVRGRLPALDLEGEIRKIYSDKTYGGEGLKADLSRCGGEAQTMGQWLTEMGKHLLNNPVGK